MFGIVGLALVFVMVFVPYILGGGSMVVIFHALIFELPMIAGASIGAFLLGNSPATIKRATKDVGLAFKGSHWTKQDYLDILSLMFIISKTIKQKGMLAMEPHIENPINSTLFQQYPKILSDDHVINFICDNLRMVSMAFEDPLQVEDNLQRQIDKMHHEETAGATALTTMSDGLPAIGIVAAVLGVIKTMASIDKPPNVLGAMIGGALVGTFLGVFLSYCLVGPIANKAKTIHDEDAAYMNIIKNMLVAHLKGNAPQISVEIGRGLVPSKIQPTFFELESVINEAKLPS